MFPPLVALLALTACSDKDFGGAAGLSPLTVEGISVAANLQREQPRWRLDVESQQFGGDPSFPDPGIPVVDDVPLGYRTSVSLGEQSWLQAELYSRRENARVSDFLSVVADPDNPDGRVIRLSSIDHTDGVLLRSKDPLPKNYRISFRIGHIDFGGKPPLNGYSDGEERGSPWMDIRARNHNGVYWAAIMDTAPQPNNNIWSHHHRKFFIDTWNYPGRMFGVTIAGVLGKSRTDPNTGKSFVAHDGTDWNDYSVTPGLFYVPERWYRVIVERRRGDFRFSVNGELKDVGYATVEGQLNAEEKCLYHYNRSASELDESCLVGDSLQIGDKTILIWPSGSAYADYFMLGDPHINFYEGSVLVDDLRLDAI
ncbi:MAG: hypothetical protein AAGI88_10280 [Pseudomonadota bacterium]